MLVLGIYQS